MTRAGSGPRGKPVVVRLTLLPAGGPTLRALGWSFLAHAFVLLFLWIAARPARPLLTTPLTVSLVSLPLQGQAPQRRMSPPPREKKPRVVSPDTPPVAPAPEVAEPRGIEATAPIPKAKSKPPAPVATPEPPPPIAAPSAESAPLGPEAGTVEEGMDMKARVEGGAAIGDEYLARLVARVSREWVKPRVGLPSRSTILLFEMRRDGRITDMEVEQASGNDIYDLSARRALELAQPLPPLPPVHRAATLKVHFEFIP